MIQSSDIFCLLFIFQTLLLVTLFAVCFSFYLFPANQGTIKLEFSYSKNKRYFNNSKKMCLNIAFWGIEDKRKFRWRIKTLLTVINCQNSTLFFGIWLSDEICCRQGLMTTDFLKIFFSTLFNINRVFAVWLFVAQSNL